MDWVGPGNFSSEKASNMDGKFFPTSNPGQGKGWKIVVLAAGCHS
jgi:hypothetical protein